MSMKQLVIKLATTGLKSNKNCITTLSCRVVYGSAHFNAEDSELYLVLQPHPKAEISQAALDYQGITLEYLDERGTPQDEAFRTFTKFLSRFVDKFDSRDKLVLVGFGLDFDLPFLKMWFALNNSNEYGSYFYNASIDYKQKTLERLAMFNDLPRSIKFDNFVETYNLNKMIPVGHSREWEKHIADQVKLIAQVL